MRTFVALELPEAFVDDAVGVARALKEKVPGRYMARDTYHVTLAFLGEQDEAGVGRAIEAIDAACVGFEPLSVRCDGLGKFGRKSDATLWMGLARDPELMRLADRLREELDAREVDYDEKAFKPHLTLARRASIPDGKLPKLAFPADDVADTVTLFKSILKSEGATYKPLHTVVLGEKRAGD